MNTYTRIFMSSWHKGMKVVRARRRVPFPRINQGNKLIEGVGREGSPSYFQNEAIFLPERVLSREKARRSPGKFLHEKNS